MKHKYCIGGGRADGPDGKTCFRVHDLTERCFFMPSPGFRTNLGWHDNFNSAIRAAKALGYEVVPCSLCNRGKTTAVLLPNNDEKSEG